MSSAGTISLERELAYFDQHRSELVDRAKGKFALIKGESLMGIYDDQLAAIEAGYRGIGDEPFLVKQIAEVDMPVNFTSFNIGF
jgi:hypothetical protein